MNKLMTMLCCFFVTGQQLSLIRYLDNYAFVLEDVLSEKK